MAYSKLVEVETLVGANIEKHYQCPFVPAHTIRKEKFGKHLRKCLRGISQTKNPFSMKALYMDQCPYNTLHYVMSTDLDEHKKICEDRPEVPLVSPKPNKKLPKCPTQEETFGPQEMWDDEPPVHVNATKKVEENTTLIYMPQDRFTKSQRRQFRRERQLKDFHQQPPKA